MDIVLGVSVTTTTVRMVLIEGENADGVIIECSTFDTAAGAVKAALQNRSAPQSWPPSRTPSRRAITWF